ncbi:DUF4956 domain-containing protein [Carboxylicivirga marina]|uniref:DUF4956 domain-containing protein n=1 Tax=Carboxylicivirga marina TaxID=2800988 RepID=A0ABS1HN91_9BACT|nr:DUF4956 domain-containing protein [Carboxylicivirga marina]MBK3519153.1 DUF4956 domain-containing protein [Carboxylicivirga marina]
MEITLVNWTAFVHLIFYFSFNLLVTTVLVRFLYYRSQKRKDYLFTFIMISSIVFLLCFLLVSVKLELGFALGLFAIFGIIRYRTTPIPIKEMTYLFIVIGVSVINALSRAHISYLELIFVNVIIVAITYGLERIWLLRHESSKMILYEKIELIKPEFYQDLIDDLKNRTGLPIHRAEIKKISFLRDTAQVIIYYYTDDVSNVTEADSMEADEM